MTPARAIVRETARSFDLFGRTARADALITPCAACCYSEGRVSVPILALKLGRALSASFQAVARFCHSLTSEGLRRLHNVGMSGALMRDPLKLAFALVTSLLCVWLLMALGGVVNAPALQIATLSFDAIMPLLAVPGLAAAALFLLHVSNAKGRLLLPAQPDPDIYGPNPNEVPQ